jgi:glycosyltransferase involved in cell wall biosynthesis
MDVAVNAIAISPGGGLTILEQFINYAKKTEINYHIFISEDIQLTATSNISLIKMPRMNWLSRILWDFKGFSSYLKKNNIKCTRIISLQNTTSNVSCRQIVYIHQSLPFYSLNVVLKTKSFKFFFYHFFYSFFIFLYGRSDTSYVVQSNWLKKTVLKKKKKLQENKIYVCRPDNPRFDDVSAETLLPFDDTVRLFYPAAPHFYKNHILLLRSLSLLNKSHDNYELRVTFSKGDYQLFDALVEKFKLNDSVKYLGFLNRLELKKEYYSCHAMLFPSSIETFGLPLAEAASIGVKILAADLPYARDVLNGYSGALFLNDSDVEGWRKEIAKIPSSKGERFPPLCDDDLTKSGWDVFFKKLVSGEI